LVQHFIHAIVAMLAIANPIVATPLFAAITEGMSKSQRRHSVLVACVAVLVILGGAVLVGTFILQVFGIGLDAFRFGGGLIIVLMGLILVAMGAQFLVAGLSGFMSSMNIQISPNILSTPSD